MTSVALTSTYIGFGSGANVLTGSSDITWDSGNKYFSIGNPTTKNSTLNIKSINFGVNYDLGIQLANAAQDAAVYFTFASANKNFQILSSSADIFIAGANNIKHLFLGYDSNSSVPCKVGLRQATVTNGDIEGTGHFYLNGTTSGGLTIKTPSNTGNNAFVINNGSDVFKVLDNGKVSGTYFTSNTNVKIGLSSGSAITTGADNICIGLEAGKVLTTINNNVLIGAYSGWSLTGNGGNIGVGINSLVNFVSGSNIAMGSSAMQGGASASGTGNIGIGQTVARVITTGNYNVMLGYEAAWNLTTGSGNVIIGQAAGESLSTGSNNVFIGKSAGSLETGSNKLYISNSNTATPLIYGEFDNSRLVINGTIETMDPGQGQGKWKLGKKITATVSLVTTDYIEVEIDGIDYKLALATV